MAVTGIILFGFVLVHMIGNLKLYEAGESTTDGATSEYLDAYGFFLRHVGEPLVPADTLPLDRPHRPARRRGAPHLGGLAADAR